MTDNSKPHTDSTSSNVLTRIVERCRGGDRSAQKQLYETMKRPVYAYVLRFLGNADVAEELVQDIFLKVLTGLPDLKDNSLVVAWIFRIAINTCRDFERKRRIRQFFMRSNSDDVFDTPVDHVDSYLRLFINRAINKLPPAARSTFILHDVQGFTHQEIATIMGWTEGTSKSQLFKARKQLRHLMHPVSKEV